MFDLVRLYCVHVKLWPSDSQEKGNLDGLRPPPGYNKLLFYISSAGFPAWAGQPVPVASTQRTFVRKQYSMRWGFSNIQKYPWDLPHSSHLCLKPIFGVSVGADTFSSHMPHVHNTRLIFPHQQINFITCFGEILSVCTFTSRSLVDLCNINRLRVLKGASWCPGTYLQDCQTCVFTSKLEHEKSLVSITLSWMFPEFTEVLESFP